MSSIAQHTASTRCAFDHAAVAGALDDAAVVHGDGRIDAELYSKPTYISLLRSGKLNQEYLAINYLYYSIFVRYV